MLRLALALLFTAAPLAGGTAQNGATQLAGRVPAAALPAIDSIIATAVAESLPTEPLVQKALEGSAKKIPADRLVGGVRNGLLQLRAARMLVARSVPGQPLPEGHVAAVAAALARGVPAPIVERLNAVINDSLKAPEMQATLEKFGSEAKISTPHDFAAYLAAETAKWGAAGKAARVQLD